MSRTELHIPETAAEVRIKNALRDQWDDFWFGDGTFDTAWIHLGWYDVNEPDHPQITVTPAGETPRGERGYEAIDPSGAGPSGHVDGTVMINVWMPHEPYPYDTLGDHPRKFITELRKTCEKIVGQLYNGTLDDDGDPEYKKIAPGGWERRATAPDGPVEYRHELTAFYTYHRGRITVETDEGS